MTNKMRYSGLFILIALLLVSCGPSEKEKQQREQARQDSIRQARQDSLQRIQQQRQDSLKQIRADSLAKAQQEQASISLNQNGTFSLQVESWRSKVKAQQRADTWKDRGFNHAFVVQYGNEDTGNVWYRVRLGSVDSREKAQEVQQKLQEKYQTKSWIGASS